MTDLAHLFDAPEALALWRVKRERDALLRLIAKAPHAHDCDAGSPMWPSPCTCWKSEADLVAPEAS